MNQIGRTLASVTCVVAVALSASRCTQRDGETNTTAEIERLRGGVESLTVDTAKAEFFFPGELDNARTSWLAVNDGADPALDALSAAHEAYMGLGRRINEIAWISTFGGDGYEEAADIATLREDGYLVVADTTSFGAGQRDAFIVEVDVAGNETQRFAFGGADNDSAAGVLKRTDGSLLVAGRTSSYNDWTGDAYVVAADSTGTELWHKTFGATGTDSFECVFPTSDGFIAFGNTFDGGGGKNILVVRLDHAGEELQKTILPGEQDDWVSAGVALSDGSFALCGGRGTINASDIEFLLLVMKADGAVVSEHTFDHAGMSTAGAVSIALANDGSYYMLGQTMESMETSEDVILLHVSAQGELLWHETMRADAEEVAGGVVATEDGAVFAATTQTYGAGGHDILLVKYSADGNEVWARTLGSSDDESARAIAHAPDGGFVIVGERGTFIEGVQDLYVVKTNADGFSWLGTPFGSEDLEESPDRQPPRPTMPAAAMEESLAVGDDAPPVIAARWFNVPDALKDVLKPNAELYAETLGAKVLVVEFWATWCFPCRESIPHLNEIHREYGDDGVVILSLTDENAADAPVEQFMRENKMETTVGSGSPSGNPFGAWTIPHAIVIDRYGKVLWLGHPMDPAFEEVIKAGLEAGE